jgi:glycosyltransferase involved in cell wall biosynthesis
MKILYIIKSLEKGGAERYALDLCLELNRRSDIEYKLLVLQEGNDYEFLSSNVNYQRLDGPFVPSILRKTHVNVDQYKEIIDNFKPDIIHTHLFRSELFSSIYVPQDVAFVVHGHDNMREFRNLSLNSFFKKSLLTNFYEKQLLVRNKYRKNRNTYFIANSPDTLNYYQNTVPSYLKQNVRLIEYGFDFNRFYLPGAENKIPNKKFSIVNIGRYEERKNQRFIVKIADRLKQKNFDFEINLLGTGECIDKVREQIKTLNLEDEVFVRGNVDYVEEYLAKADLYLHTAYYEPFGLVLLEAMAAGLPCIILDGRGNRNLVKNDYNGYIFSEQNAEIFANKIIELSKNSDLLKQLSQNAQLFAKTYNISEKTNELIEFYKSIISKNSVNEKLLLRL